MAPKAMKAMKAAAASAPSPMKAMKAMKAKKAADGEAGERHASISAMGYLKYLQKARKATPEQKEHAANACNLYKTLDPEQKKTFLKKFSDAKDDKNFQWMKDFSQSLTKKETTEKKQHAGHMTRHQLSQMLIIFTCEASSSKPQEDKASSLHACNHIMFVLYLQA